MDQDGIVAIGLLTRRDLNLLGPTFSRLWPIEDAPRSFEELLRAIDQADEEVRRTTAAARHEPAQHSPSGHREPR